MPVILEARNHRKVSCTKSTIRDAEGPHEQRNSFPFCEILRSPKESHGNTSLTINSKVTAGKRCYKRGPGPAVNLVSGAYLQYRPRGETQFSPRPVRTKTSGSWPFCLERPPCGASCGKATRARADIRRQPPEAAPDCGSPVHSPLG